jgi:hypothetical protein|tara:strand:- start:3087 stop:3407 length:321 start_codon:yes stop_codon:yes gene_type:complete
MPDEPVDGAFAKWHDEYGYIATEIYKEIQKTSHLLDTTDGNHAKWNQSDLGILIVLPYERAMAFAAENIVGDFNESPLHNYVFSTMTNLIMESMDALDQLDDLDQD